MNIKLPIQTKEIKDDKLVKEITEKEFRLDTSLVSQIRFEAKFPELAKNEDLFEYTKRISTSDALKSSVLISKIKVLYCWLESDMDFIEFLRLFDLSDIEYVKQLTGKVKYVFDIIFNGSAEKN